MKMFVNFNHQGKAVNHVKVDKIELSWIDNDNGTFDVLLGDDKHQIWYDYHTDSTTLNMILSDPVRFAKIEIQTANDRYDKFHTLDVILKP